MDCVCPQQMSVAKVENCLPGGQYDNYQTKEPIDLIILNNYERPIV